MTSRKLSFFEYYIKHYFSSGFHSLWAAFRIWCDLISGNHEGYALLEEDIPFEECRAWFWVALGEDNIYPKDFLEHLYELCDRVRRGEEELGDYPLEL